MVTEFQVPSPSSSCSQIVIFGSHFPAPLELLAELDELGKLDEVNDMIVIEGPELSQRVSDRV